MSNHLVLAVLEKQRDDLYNLLSRQTISGLFREEYRLMSEGSVALLGETTGGELEELKDLGEDTSHDNAFRELVEAVKQMDNASVTRSLAKDVEKLLDYISANGYESKLQAIFIEYDWYYHFKGVAMGLGRQAYPLIYEPRYLAKELDFSKAVFNGYEAINFAPAWPNCEAFEWTTEHLQVYYDLMQLFQLHSRVLLHQAIKQLDEQGRLRVLATRPFMFYIREHDCEVMTLYTAE